MHNDKKSQNLMTIYFSIFRVSTVVTDITPFVWIAKFLYISYANCHILKKIIQWPTLKLQKLIPSLQLEILLDLLNKNVEWIKVYLYPDKKMPVEENGFKFFYETLNPVGEAPKLHEVKKSGWSRTFQEEHGVNLINK